MATPTVLLVSGSVQTTRSVKRLLDSGFNVLNAENGQQAWALLQEDSRICLVICSLRIAIEGDALLERLRQAKDHKLAMLPTLLLIAETDSDEACETAFSQGANDYIKMPFSALELKTRVRLHSRVYNLQQSQSDLEVLQDAGIDLLNTLMQQESYVSRLSQELQFCVRHHANISVALVSITNADDIIENNDQSVFTATVRTIARQLEKRIRREDSFAYLGGGTFALLFPVTNGLGANVAIGRILEHLGALHLKHDDRMIELTLNAALFSSLPKDNLTPDDILDQLEQRLDTAKKMGPGQVVSSKHEMQEAKLSIDQALNKIRYDQTEGLDRYLPDLLRSMQPLLEYANEHHAPELQEIIDNLDD